MTIHDLLRILRECAGAAEDGALDGDVLDTEFEALGYDSLALLETGGHIEREYGIQLADDTVMSARTPRQLLAVVNAA